MIIMQEGVKQEGVKSFKEDVVYKMGIDDAHLNDYNMMIVMIVILFIMEIIIGVACL